MSEELKPFDEDLNSTILWGLRYCLGRMSYAAGDCVNFLTTNWERISPRYHNLIVRDINEAIEDGNAGMDCDVEAWKSILKLAKEKNQ